MTADSVVKGLRLELDVVYAQLMLTNIQEEL